MWLDKWKGWEYDYLMEVIRVDIKKPLYGNYIYINGNVIDKAISAGCKIGVTIPKGRALIDPQKWKDNGKIMKKVFKFPDNPMILYGGYLDIDKGKGKIVETVKEEVKEEIPKLF